MNKLMAFVLMLVLVAGPGPTALAQDAGMVSQPEATRVVIAPARTPLAQAIKQDLARAYYGAAKNTRAYTEAQRLYFLYGARHFEPLWINQESGKKVTFSPAANRIVGIFKSADREGLRPADYLTPDLDLSTVGTDPARLAELETAFSAATLRYAQHLYAGRIRPAAVSDTFDVAPKRIDATAIMESLASGANPARVLAALEPKHREFQALKAALARFDAPGATQPAAIPAGPTLKPGMRDARVTLLRQRLEIPVPADDSAEIYDSKVVDAIQAFQASLGLTADGITGPATIAALNGGAATTREDIVANMERWRWAPQDLGDFNVMVNIPEFRLSVNKQGHEAYSTRVVVGTTQHQTPIFSDMIRHIVVNPYWNVPNSIIRNEIAPKVAANPGYIQSQNMELLYNGNVVHASQINWDVVGPGNFPFRVRQKPGPNNALGKVKFLFPNSHDVYLHDTPSKGLFERSHRAFSHGCVRVQNPMDFADALLANEPKLDAQALEALYGPSERWVNPQTKVPVHLTYFTLRVAEDGTIHAFGDVYGHNKKLIELMAG